MKRLLAQVAFVVWCWAIFLACKDAPVVQHNTTFGSTYPTPSGNGLAVIEGGIYNKTALSGDAGLFLSWDGSAPIYTSLPLPTDLNVASEAQGDILYYNGANWVRLAAGTSGYYLKTQGASANPVWALAPEAGIGNLITYYDKDLTTLSNATISSDTTQTIDGNATWRSLNSANTSTNTVVTNGTGIVFKPSSTTDMNGATTTAPVLGPTLSSLISNFDTSMHVRVWVRATANYTANYDATLGGFFVWTSGTTLQAYASGKLGYNTSGVGAGMNLTVNSTAVQSYDNALTFDDCMVVDMPDGVYGVNAQVFTGTYSAGWPAAAALKARSSTRGTSNTFATSDAGLRTGNDAYVFLGGQRAGSGTSLTITFKNIRVDAR